MNREERLARNEALFREVNERIEEVKAPHEGEFEILCECGSRECTAVVSLSTEAYEALRADPTTFAVIPGHEIADVEDVVREAPRLQRGEQTRRRERDRPQD